MLNNKLIQSAIQKKTDRIRIITFLCTDNQFLQECSFRVNLKCFQNSKVRPILNKENQPNKSQTFPPISSTIEPVLRRHLYQVLSA